jgi:hypothetical protein
VVVEKRYNNTNNNKNNMSIHRQNTSGISVHVIVPVRLVVSLWFGLLLGFSGVESPSRDRLPECGQTPACHKNKYPSSSNSRPSHESASESHTERLDYSYTTVGPTPYSD